MACVLSDAAAECSHTERSFAVDFDTLRDQKVRKTLAATALALAFATSAASQEDPHRVYELRCHGCHSEHGADLARQKLKIDKDALTVNRTGTPLDTLLRKHHGVALSSAERSALVGLFQSGIRWAGVYQRLCASCHDKAVGFARERLVVKAGRVLSRRNDAEIDAFLKTHGGASDSEIETLLEMFRYQLETDIGKPTK